MGSKFLIYDPESNPDPKLVVGQRYPARRDPGGARGTWLLEVSPGNTVACHSRDLCNQRDKPEPKLRQVAVHVVYEAAILIHAYADHARRTSYTAWFVHYRNLSMFFRGKGHDEDEACAQDFFPEPRSWHDLRRKVRPPSDPGLVLKYENAANELAVHLSYNRDQFLTRDVTPNAELTAYVQRLLWAFLDALPPTGLTWFSEAAMFQALGERPAA